MLIIKQYSAEEADKLLREKFPNAKHINFKVGQVERFSGQEMSYEFIGLEITEEVKDEH